MSFARRSTSEGIHDDVSEQTKPTGIHVVCCEEILICPCVLEYATLAINLALFQHSHLKLDMLDRKEQIFARKPDSYSPVSSKSARSRHYDVSLNPPDRATTISRLITQSIVRSRERCCKKMNIFDDVAMNW